MNSNDDVILASLEDTQPITIGTEVFHDDCGWWERFGRDGARDSGDESPGDRGRSRHLT
jgi:hypothetical protein